MSGPIGLPTYLGIIVYRLASHGYVGVQCREVGGTDGTSNVFSVIMFI